MKALFLIIWICLIPLSSGLAQTFQNPVIRGMNPDPTICRVGDDFYLVTSTFEYFPGLPVYHSKDLVNWKMIGYALSRASNCPLIGAASGTGGNYAPSIRHHNGTFYITCTNYGGQGSQGAFYVTATNPAGPWSDPYWVDNWGVDPSLLFDNDSVYYVYPDANNNFLLATVNLATGKFHKAPKVIAQGTGAASQEGPHLYKIGSYYYLMSAEGGTGSEHMEVIQRSTSPWGPYQVSPANPVITHKTSPSHPFQAIGHADLVQLQDDSWWLVCLGIRPKGGNYHHLGRETFLAPVAWDMNGWPKGGANGIIGENLALPNLTPHSWPQDPVRDQFDSVGLKLMWNFVRNPHAADWSLTDNPGFLRLNGSSYSFKEKNSPAFVGRRQAAFNMIASTKVSFTPTANNEEAGLVVRGDDYNHYDLVVTTLGTEKVVLLRKYLQDKVTSVNYLSIPTGDVILRVSATDLQYKFWVQETGKTAVLIGTALTKDLSTELIGGFTGTYIGMYASGNGAANTNPADFDWFDYEEEPPMPYAWSVGDKDSLNHMIAPEIVSLSSSTYTTSSLVWKNVSNATSYTVERFIGNTFVSVGTTQVNDTVFNDTGLSGNTMYVYRIIANNSEGNSLPSIAASVWTKHAPGPFSGTPAPIQGKIEVENYDYGDSNDSWSDANVPNNGEKYRTDGVDISGCWDSGGGHHIGWIDDGEWLVYTVNVNDSLVNLELRVLTWWNSGGHVKFELDGVTIAETNIAHTNGTWSTITLTNIVLTKGLNKKLKLVFVKGGFDLNWIHFKKVSQTTHLENAAYAHGIKVYPNPASSLLNISCLDFKYTQLEIQTLEGKQVMTRVGTFLSENTLPISLPEGQYILLLSNHEERRSVKFVVK